MKWFHKKSFFFTIDGFPKLYIVKYIVIGKVELHEQWQLLLSRRAFTIRKLETSSTRFPSWVSRIWDLSWNTDKCKSQNLKINVSWIGQSTTPCTVKRIQTKQLPFAHHHHHHHHHLHHHLYHHHSHHHLHHHHHGTSVVNICHSLDFQLKSIEGRRQNKCNQCENIFSEEIKLRRCVHAYENMTLFQTFLKMIQD